MAALPLRSCVACRMTRPKAELIRVHLAPGGGLGVDLGGGSGRGAYVCPQRSCLESAVKRGEFSRCLKVGLPPLTVETLERLIRERASRQVASLLGLARRARKIVSGAEAVESAVRRHAARVVLTATDASASSLAKIRSLVAEEGGSSQSCLGKVELGAALGGAPRACVAITDARFAGAVLSVLAKIPREAASAGGPEDRAADSLDRDVEGLEVMGRGNR